MRHQCHAVCTPGLEAVLADELKTMGVKTGTPARGGIGFRANDRQLYAANCWLRTANRVVVRAGRFRARSFEDLVDGVRALDWGPYLADDQPVHLRVSSTASRLHHTGAIAQRVAGALRRPVVDEAGDDTQLVVVRASHDEFTLSVDSSGEALHRRPWRTDVAKAPLRPTLAAAMLRAVGWDGTRALVDPFCGSGTIAVEAALMARDLPPGGERSFAFAGWPSFSPGTWASVAGEVASRARANVDVAIVAADRDAGAVAATVANAQRAGVADDVGVVRRSVSDLARPEGPPGWMITNPPYGRRVVGGRTVGTADVSDLRNLYARLGTVATDTLSGWDVALLVADERMAGHTGLDLAERWRSDNGGISVKLLATPPAPADSR
jgi:putative N6-adenine-specific DNA methylase